MRTQSEKKAGKGVIGEPLHLIGREGGTGFLNQSQNETNSYNTQLKNYLGPKVNYFKS